MREYIATRKLYFVSQAIKENKDRKLCDIAQDFGYSEQSVLNRVMKKYYGYTPGEIKTKDIIIPDNKYSMADFQDQKNDSRLDKIFNKLDDTGYISSHDSAYLDKLYALSQEYKFDLNETYQIAELAERLNIFVDNLMRACFELSIVTEMDIEEKMQIAIKLGLESEEELDELCEFYQCHYYEVDDYMVYRYFQNIEGYKKND